MMTVVMVGAAMMVMIGLAEVLLADVPTAEAAVVMPHCGVEGLVMIVMIAGIHQPVVIGKTDLPVVAAVAAELALIRVGHLSAVQMLKNQSVARSVHALPLTFQVYHPEIRLSRRQRRITKRLSGNCKRRKKRKQQQRKN